MATILEELDVKLEFADLYKRIPLRRGPVPQERTHGVHQSGILTYIARKIKILGPDEKPEDEYPLIWALGQAWEEFCVSLYPEIDWQPGEMCKNEIWRSIDGINPHGLERLFDCSMTGPVIEEFKYTHKKVRCGQEFLDEWMWMHQGRGYCSALETIWVRWHVMYTRGDYKTFGPVYRRYLVEFTNKEIEQTEAMLVMNRDKVVSE